MNTTLLVLYASLALGVSFICSLLESVLLSTTNAHISVLQRDDKRSGQIWANLKENDSVKPLTAILTLNTISHTVGALGVGSVVGEDGHSSLAVASSLLTLAMLFGSEILPKTIGAAYWKALNAPAGRVLALLTLSLAFIVYPIEWFRNLLPSAEKVAVTRDEISVMADIGEEEGAIEADEEMVIHNLLRLREIAVREVMTPRVVIHGIRSGSTVAQVTQEHPIMRFSRIPVYGESIDDIKGFVLRSMVLTAASRDEMDRLVDEMIQDLGEIESTDSVDHALDHFLSIRQQIVRVTDEFGGTAGILTMEDVIETLLGEEIVDELDEVEDMRQLAYENASASDE